MTSTDRLAEMAAEIEHLRCEVITAKGMTRFWQVISEGKDAEIERLRARVATLLAETHWLRSRIAELESHAAVTFGTLEQPTPDESSRFTCNVPPSAPPHDE
jgi:hypothetical protein